MDYPCLTLVLNDHYKRYKRDEAFDKFLLFYFPLIPIFSLWRRSAIAKTFETINRFQFSY